MRIYVRESTKDLSAKDKATRPAEAIVTKCTTFASKGAGTQIAHTGINWDFPAHFFVQNNYLGIYSNTIANHLHQIQPYTNILVTHYTKIYFTK